MISHRQTIRDVINVSIDQAVELTPQRGASEFVDLPPGVNGTELLSILQTTYGQSNYIMGA